MPTPATPEYSPEAATDPAAHAFYSALDHTRTALDAFRARDLPGLPRILETLHACRGRIVVCGMGKSGHIGKKMAATFASTGSPATFLHPAEALHGDLGFVAPEDVLLLLSNSGETAEITAILPYLRRLGNPLIALTGCADSTLARHCHACLDVAVAREADPINMAPTASTTLLLAVGDALAAALMTRRGFTRDDYARYHPGGSLGARLLFRVAELMHTGDAIPRTRGHITVREAILEMTAKRLGAVFVVDEHDTLQGILTDGDLRRLFQTERFQQDPQPLERPVADCMVRGPRRIQPDVPAAEALREMELPPRITIFPVVDAADRLQGALHIHDLIAAGIRSSED